jgi:LysM repeat protein
VRRAWGLSGIVVLTGLGAACSVSAPSQRGPTLGGPIHNSPDQTMQPIRLVEAPRRAERPRAGEVRKKAHARVASVREVTVAPGETLLVIAQRHRVSVSALVSENRLSDLNVRPGTQLVIPR